MNSRLDEIQAAILRARLKLLPAWTDRRRALASRYRTALAGGPVRVMAEADPGHVYHLFVVRPADRGEFQAHMERAGVGTLIHYPVPIPRQRAFEGLHAADCPIADRACAEICSIPLHQALTDADADAVVEAVREWRPASTRANA